MAKFQAQLWSGVGRLYPGARLVLLDLHTDLVLNYFEGAVFPDHVTSIPWLLDKAFAHNAEDRILATVDTGQMDEIRIQADRLNVGLAFIEKTRHSATETEVEGVYGDPVEGKHVIIVDDVIATAGSLCNAAVEYAKRGAASLSAVAAHGLFAGAALEKLDASPIVRVDVTNSHPAATGAATASQLVHVHRLDRTTLTAAR